MRPARGCVIVKPVTTSQTLGGSPIIIPEPYREQMASHQMIVQSVGAEDLCDNPDECDEHHVCGQSAPNTREWPFLMYWHPTDKRIKPDAWILVRNRSLVEISAEQKLYSVKQSDVLGVFTEGV